MAKPPTTMQRTVKWARRNPTKSVAVAVATVAFVAISGLAWKLKETNLELEIRTYSQSLQIATNYVERSDSKRAREELSRAKVKMRGWAWNHLNLQSDNSTRVFTEQDRKSTRLNSSHAVISYAVFCL